MLKRVGIDINSVISVANVSWNNNITEGKVTNAWIRYDSSTKKLSVVCTGFINNIISTIAFTVLARGGNYWLLSNNRSLT